MDRKCQNILVECGLPGVWYNKYVLNGKLLKSLVLQKLKIFSSIIATQTLNLTAHKQRIHV